MKMLPDMHSHILVHGMDAMINGATQAGLKRISITEHISQFKEIRDSIRFVSLHKIGTIFNNVQEYEGLFQDANRPGISVYIGLEIDFIPSRMNEISDFVNSSKATIRNLSIHEINNRDIESIGIVSPETSRNTWVKYMKKQEDALEIDKLEATTLSHPVRLARSLKVVPYNIDDILENLADRAASHEIALEINGYDLEIAPLLVDKMARACGEKSCKVTYGSDAHEPWRYLAGMKGAENLIKKYSLKLG